MNQRIPFQSWRRQIRCALAAVLPLAVGLLSTSASENVAHRPFAMYANLPEPGQFIVGAIYEESEAYHIWAGGRQYNVAVRSAGEKYGIDMNQGYLSGQYGINERWAADLSIGYTSAGFRPAPSVIDSTSGLMDVAFGVRYQVFREDPATHPWLPTLTLRAGAVLPGSFAENFPFAPGTRSAAIEPEVLARKHFGWPGLGAYLDALFRWNRTTGNDQYLTAVGLFQELGRWELAAGYRHLQTITGSDLIYLPGATPVLIYPRDPREINDAVEAGFSYTTAWHNIRLGFHSRTSFAGNNSDRKFWVGGSIDIPLGGRKRSDSSSGRQAPDKG